MSINFKNSLFKKINATTSVFLEDQSQMQQSKINTKKSRKDYFDTSSSSSEEERSS